MLGKINKFQELISGAKKWLKRTSIEKWNLIGYPGVERVEI